MSPLSEMPEPGRANLRQALSGLPPYEPDPATWERIEARLATDEVPVRAIAALPAHDPDEELWGQIAARLDAGQDAGSLPEPAAPAVVRRLWPAQSVRRIMAIAASVVLLIGTWWQLRPVPPAAPAPHETVAFSEEEIGPQLPPLAATIAPDSLGQQGLSFIDSRCSALPTVCQSGEFRSLRTQLTELETQQEQLRQDARRFGESPEVLRQQARLVTLKAAITRELVQLLIS